MGGLIKEMTKQFPWKIDNRIWMAKAFQFFYHHGVSLYGVLAATMGPYLGISPLVLRLRVTKRCNLHCNYCYQAGSLNAPEKNHLSYSEWERVLDNLPRWTILDITGGEPFVATNFKELIELALGKGFRTSLITNGSHCREDILEILVKNKLMYFMVSLDGTSDVHNRLRGQSGSFEKAMKTIDCLDRIKKNYKSSYPIICIKTTVTAENCENLEEFQSMIMKNKAVQDHSLNILFQNSIRGGGQVETKMSSKFYEGNTLSLPPEGAALLADKVSLAVRNAQKMGRSLNLKPMIDLRLLRDYFSSPSSFAVKNCSKVKSVMTMYFDGSITPCDIGLNVGNIRDIDYDLSKIYAQSSFKSFWGHFINDKKYRPYCDGCCLMPHTKKPQ